MKTKLLAVFSLFLLILSCSKDEAFDGKVLVGKWQVKTIASFGIENGNFQPLDSSECQYLFYEDGLLTRTCSTAEHSFTWYYQEATPKVVLVDNDSPFTNIIEYDVIEYGRNAQKWENVKKRISNNSNGTTTTYINLKSLTLERID